MGQRHQLFVIAKIGRKYRCLAVVHHQWLYGHTALRRCRDLLDIFSNPQNHVPIQEELIQAETKDEKFWSLDDPSSIYRDRVTVPFPFVMTCLILGASFSPMDGYYHGVTSEPFRMAYNQGDNNNGITIIDISDLRNVRYCFVDFYGMESEREVQLMAPLSARTYLEAYYELDLPEYKDLNFYVEQLDGFQLVQQSALEDTWPGEGWEWPEAEDDAECLSRALEATHISDTAHAEERQTLRELAFEKLLEHIIEGGQIDEEALAAARELNDFLEKLKAKILANSATLRLHKDLLDVFVECFKDNVHFDASKFESLENIKMTYILEKLLQEGAKMEALNLSRSKLTEDEILSVLTGKSTLKRVYLMSNETISPKKISSLKPSFEVYFSTLFRRDLQEEDSPTKDDQLDGIDFASESNPVVQISWLGIGDGFFLNESAYLAGGGLNYGLMEHSRTSSSRFGHFTVTRRQGPVCASFSLNHYPMSLNRFVGGLLMILECFSTTGTRVEEYQVQDWLASSFALGCPDLPAFSSGVGPLMQTPVMSLEDDTVDLDKSPRPAPPAGQWTLLLIHPYHDDSGRTSEPSSLEQIRETMMKAGGSADIETMDCRYAIVSRMENAEEGFKVMDLKGFLEVVKTEEAARLGEALRQEAVEMPFLRFYEEPDIHEILKHVFSSGSVTKEKAET